MNELQAQLADLEAQKTTLFDSGTIDQVQVSRLNEQIKALQAQVAQQQQQAHIETKVGEAQVQVSQSFDAIIVGDQTVTLGELAANESARQILSIYFTQYVTSLTKQHEQEKATLKVSYEAQIEEEKKSVAELEERNDVIYEQSNTLRIANAQLTASLEEMTTRRDAAAREIVEAKAEVTRLNSQVDDLRTEIAVGAKAAVQVVSITNLGGDGLGDMIREFKASRPAIYDVQAIDQKKSEFTAKLVETNEVIVFNWLDKGKYREVSPEEAERFRAEAQAAAASIPDYTPDIPLDNGVTPPPFPGEVQDVDTTVGGESTDTTVATVTRSEFEELKSRVAQLEQTKVGVAA